MFSNIGWISGNPNAPMQCIHGPHCAIAFAMIGILPPSLMLLSCNSRLKLEPCLLSIYSPNSFISLNVEMD
ncbi:MAG: hypothetical protein C5B59_02560 [Bacteroidetes bacterium]|nr:MAG: hypothetical protein C5B59_02560 [Bacteroidota bacterium]